MFGSMVDVISDRRSRLPKTRSWNTTSATLKGHRNSKIQPNSNFFRSNALDNKRICFSENKNGDRCTLRFEFYPKAVVFKCKFRISLSAIIHGQD